MKCWILLLLICFFNLSLKAQSSSLLSDGIADYIRRSQLTGKLETDRSLAVNSFSSNLEAVDTLFRNSTSTILKKSNIRLLPISETTQYNSKTGYGRNNGAMIPSAGFQGAISAGFTATIGNFSIQLKPEWLMAQNNAYETFSTAQYAYYWNIYYKWLNKIDNPESFGTEAYNKILLGQSHVEYNFKKVAVGFSNENLWWGPGRYNALIMSNNAEGFLHATIHTTSPITSNWGSIEGQLISGKLQNSNILPPDHYRYDNGQLLYKPKPLESRYLHGIIASFQPKIAKGLFLGFSLVNYGYNASNNETMGSMFARYVMPKDHAEIYIEYGRNDKMPTPMNLAVENGYPRAFVAGLRKLIPLHSKRESFIELAAEFTQLQLPTSRLTLDSNANSWYTSSSVQHGYTNNGKIIGAGIGPGSNSETIAISYLKGFNKIGVEFERYVHNNDFYYNAYSYVKDFTRHWVDVSTCFVGSYRYKHLVLNGKLGFIRSINYEWNTLEGLGYFTNGYDLFNVHANIALSYHF